MVFVDFVFVVWLILSTQSVAGILARCHFKSHMDPIYTVCSQYKIYFKLVKIWINLINFNKTKHVIFCEIYITWFYWFARQIRFLWRSESSLLGGVEWGTIMFYLDYCIFIIVEGRNQNQNCILINCTALIPSLLKSYDSFVWRIDPHFGWTVRWTVHQ